MFCKPSINQLSKSTLDSDQLQEIVVNLDETNEEFMSGGGPIAVIFILQENSVDNQPEAEGKIRGTLLLSL